MTTAPTDQGATTSVTGSVEPDPGAAGGAQKPLDKVTELTAERPELVVGAAFVGGVVLAMILRRMAAH